MVLVFSITGYFGMQAVLSLVRTFGAFVAVTVTSMRKAVSVVISFILFSKPFTLQYLVCSKYYIITCYYLIIFFLVWRNDSGIWDLLEFSIQEASGCNSADVINCQKSDELLSKAGAAG